LPERLYHLAEYDRELVDDVVIVRYSFAYHPKTWSLCATSHF
jgi:hypothetical protein